MDCDAICAALSSEAPSSNPFPFLLWIATALVYSAALYLKMCSNPFPFLLWIATLDLSHKVTCITVVTLFHFYCGLRLSSSCLSLRLLSLRLCSNPFPFLLWIATSSMWINYFYPFFSSNPFPFLLWIATIL